MDLNGADGSWSSRRRDRGEVNEDDHVARERADDLSGMFPGPLAAASPARRWPSGIWSLDAHDIRDAATDKHRTVDDTPAGGGPGMVMKADVLARALDAVPHDTRPRLLMSPRGTPLTQARAASSPRGPASSSSAAASRASTSG